MNNAIFKGWICQDAQVKYSAKGKMYEYFTIAAPREFSNSSGEYESDFIPCVLWSEKKIERIGEKLLKGIQIIVSGRMQSRSFLDKKDNKRYVIECIIKSIDFIEHNNKNREEISLDQELLDEQFDLNVFSDLEYQEQS